VTDTAAASEPIGIVTGDFVFVGDVGRPDLLEKAAKVANTMEAGARQLFHSLERFRALPDFVQVWPGHGAGSACGKALGAIPTSTVGYEKRFNWGVATTDETEFVRMVLEGQPEPPLYFVEMKRINRDGPTILGGFPTPELGDADHLARTLASGAVVIDTRPAAVFGAGHVPGTLNIPLNKSFSTWAGWLVKYDVDIALIADDAGAVASAVRDLAMIGLDRVTAWYPSTVVTTWQDAGRRLGTVVTLDPATLAPQLTSGAVTLIDVRNQSEWSAGHQPHARHIPLGHLAERLAEIPRDRPIVVQCQSGARSAIATAHLQRLGLTNVHDLLGGFQRWASEGHEVIR
jgi:hydroxyacylglutathione hydrolase